MSKSHSRNGSPSLPDLDRRRNVLSSGMPEAIVEDVETKRYRELRMANAFQIDHDFYSPRLAEADRMVISQSFPFKGIKYLSTGCQNYD